MDGLTRKQFLAAAGLTLAGALVGQDLAKAAGPRESKSQLPADELILIPEGQFLMGTPEEEAKRWARQAGYHLLAVE